MRSSRSSTDILVLLTFLLAGCSGAPAHRASGDVLVTGVSTPSVEEAETLTSISVDAESCETGRSDEVVAESVPIPHEEHLLSVEVAEKDAQIDEVNAQAREVLNTLRKQRRMPPVPPDPPPSP